MSGTVGPARIATAHSGGTNQIKPPVSVINGAHFAP